MSNDNHTPPHEQRDIKPSFIFAMLSGLVILILIILVAAVGIVRLFNGYEEPPVVDDSHLPHGAPLLQPNPHKDRVEFEATQQAYLNGYGWVDQEAGIAHIPIEDAMSRIVQDGLPEVTAEAPEQASTVPQPDTTEEATPQDAGNSSTTDKETTP